MTDRHAAYIVTLDEDIREDDAEAILSALRMVKHVLSVEPVVATYEQHIADARSDSRWRERIYRLLEETRRA